MKTRGSVAFSAYAKLNFKLIVVGDKKVGKTSLILRYIKGAFGKTTSNTNAIQFYSQTVTINNEQFALQIWDTAGADSFKSVTKSFYQQASCVVIAYCKPALAQSTIQDYLLGINEHAHEAARVVIVRTKIDEYPVQEKENQYLDQLVKTEENIVHWMAVSAKDNLNVKEFFEATAEKLYAAYHQDESFKEIVDPKKDSFVLNTKMAVPAKRKGCCG